ncbi:MAG: hypothetical protein V7785_05055 [Bermanella sp.]
MTESNNTYGIKHHGSTSHNPDLDWSQVRETITMLALAVAQVECSMSDGAQSVETLTESFTRMANYVKKIRLVTRKVTPDKLPHFQEVIENAALNLEEDVQNAVVAFQFYDRISQRLDHVCKSLDQLGGIINDQSALYNPQCWHSLQEEIKSSYTMEAERIMFEHILRGHSIKDALDIYRHHFNEAEQGQATQDGDEIELF